MWSCEGKSHEKCCVTLGAWNSESESDSNLLQHFFFSVGSVLSGMTRMVEKFNADDNVVESSTGHGFVKADGNGTQWEFWLRRWAYLRDAIDRTRNCFSSTWPQLDLSLLSVLPKLPLQLSCSASFCGKALVSLCVCDKKRKEKTFPRPWRDEKAQNIYDTINSNPTHQNHWVLLWGSEKKSAKQVSAAARVEILALECC